MKEFDDLIAVVERLRKDCPWDREQTLQSLRPFLIEESYEVLEALDRLHEDPKNTDALVEEWGDLLLQIVLQAIILRESHSEISLALIATQLKEKLIRRHPHVFGENKIKTSTEVLQQWDKLKAAEKNTESPKSLMHDIQPKTPAMLHALKIGERSHKIKFDWPTSEDVWVQVLSELKELEDETKENADKKRQEDELGDLLFSLVQWARHQKINAEAALASTNRKFLTRFAKMEELARQRLLCFDTLSLEEKENLWVEAKRALS